MIYLDFDPQNIEIDDLIAIGLDNGEILILNNENIVSKDCLLHALFFGPKRPEILARTLVRMTLNFRI